jgi:acyl-CoA hydrolase
MNLVAAADLDWTKLVRPGERVLVGQAMAEPLTLTASLVAQRARIGEFEIFLGVTYSDSFPPEGTDGIRFGGYGAIGPAAVALARAGRLDPLPWHYGALSAAFADGRLRADVVLLQLSPSRRGGPYSLSLTNDYVAHAARHARLVIAEVNPDAPWTYGAELPDWLKPDVLVAAERPPLEVPAPALGEVHAQIAAHAVGLIPDRACLQFGVGTIPDALLDGLKGHRGLGVHSGVMGDRIVDLIERGVVTNAHKGRDEGLTITNVMIGTRRLCAHIDDNPAVRVVPATYTHALDVLATIPNFIALNSAIEVDLGGQVNAEVADGVYVGAVGGQVDFVRGAAASPGGRSIIALPATARRGSISRIVAQVSTVTTPRSDVDAIVTEYGAAELRGCSLTERAKRMIAIAAPEFREGLARSRRDDRQREDPAS